MVAAVILPSFQLQSKQSGVIAGWSESEHGMLWRVCGEWVGCDVDIPHPEPARLFSNLAGWDVLSNQVPSHSLPSPLPQAHLLSPDNPTNSFHCCLLWPLTAGALSCPAERGYLKRLPGSVTSPPISLTPHLSAAKALSCLTPVELQPKFSYLQRILSTRTAICHGHLNATKNKKYKNCIRFCETESRYGLGTVSAYSNENRNQTHSCCVSVFLTNVTLFSQSQILTF